MTKTYIYIFNLKGFHLCFLQNVATEPSTDGCILPERAGYVNAHGQAG